MYLVLAPPSQAQAGPAAAAASSAWSPKRLQTLHHHNSQTHPKSSLTLHFLLQMLHYPGIPTNL